MSPTAVRPFSRPLVALLVLAAAGGASAQPETDPASPPMESAAAPNLTAERPVRYQISFASVLAFNGEFDDEEGDLTVYRSGVGFGAAIPAGARGNLDVGVEYELSSYQFDDATGFIDGTDDPWESVHRVSVSALYGVQQTERWGWFAGVSATSAGEDGADFGDTLTGGVLGGVRYALADGLTVGFGAGVRTRLEDHAMVIPVVQLDWKINDEWSLSTGGQPGLTLGYAPCEAWMFTASAGWEFRNFRLDSDGPLPDGVVSETRIPVSVGAVWRPTPQLSFSGAVGAYFGQSYEVSDEDGHEVADVDAETTPFLALKVAFSF